MGQIGRNCGRRFVDRAKAVARVGAHEALNLGDAFHVDTRRDVDQYERREGCALTCRQQGRNAAERCSDYDGQPMCPLGERARERGGVGSKIVEPVGAIRNPFGSAVTTLVDRISHHPGLGDAIGRCAPSIAGLAAAMEQQHRAGSFIRRAIGLRAEHVADQAIPARSGKGDPTRLGVRLGGRRHGRSARNSSTASLNTRSPTESM